MAAGHWVTEMAAGHWGTESCMSMVEHGELNPNTNPPAGLAAPSWSIDYNLLTMLLSLSLSLSRPCPAGAGGVWG